MNKILNEQFLSKKLNFVEEAIIEDNNNIISILKDLLIDEYKNQALQIILPYIEVNVDKIFEILSIFNTKKHIALSILLDYVDKSEIANVIRRYRRICFSKSDHNEAVKVIVNYLYTNNLINVDLIIVLLNLYSDVDNEIIDLLLSHLDIKTNYYKLPTKNIYILKKICQTLKPITINTYCLLITQDPRSVVEIVKFMPCLKIYDTREMYIELLSGLFPIHRYRRKVKNMLINFLKPYPNKIAIKSLTFQSSVELITYLYVKDTLTAENYTTVKKLAGNPYIESLLNRSFLENKYTFIEYMIRKRRGTSTQIQKIINNKDIHKFFIQQVKYRKIWKDKFYRHKNYLNLFKSSFDVKSLLVYEIEGLNIDMQRNILLSYVNLIVNLHH